MHLHFASDLKQCLLASFTCVHCEMKSFLVLCAVVALVIAEEKYTTNNDDFDIEALIANVPELKNFNTCFINDTNCNDVSSDFKRNLPEAVREACAKCTDVQKHIFRRYLEGLQEKLPQQFEEFRKKFDPEGIYLEPLKAALAKA